MGKRVLCLSLLVFALSGRPAFADPLQITSGAFLVDIEGDTFSLSADGIRLTTTVFGNYLEKLFPARCSGTGWPFQSCPQPDGTPGDWSFLTTGGEQLLGTGDAVIDGTVTGNVSFLGSLRFDVVPTTVSADGRGEFDWDAPFTFEATIRGVQNGQQLFTNQFVGRGRVSLRYEVGPAGFVGLNADTDTIRYEFVGPDPVPEPATILLIAPGLAAAALRRRRVSARPLSERG